MALRMRHEEVDIAKQIKELICDFQLTQQELADILMTRERTVSRWITKKSLPLPVYRKNIEKLVDIHERLSKTIKKKAFPKWLFTYNESLKDKPVNLLKKQDYEAVLEDVINLEEGIFT